METKLLQRRPRTAGHSAFSKRPPLAGKGAVTNDSMFIRRAASARPARGNGGREAWTARENPRQAAETPPTATIMPISTAAKGLHSAVEKGRFHQLRFLIDFGADLNLKNERGEGVLVTALRIPGDRCRQKMFSVLLRLGAALEDLDPVSGRDTLLWACYLGRDDQVRRLLQVCPGDLNFSRKDHAGNTCLHYVVEAEKEDIVRLIARSMKRFGLPVDIPDANGVTPYIHAKRYGYEDIQEVLVNEGNASPSQFDLDELDLLGSSAAANPQGADSAKAGSRNTYHKIRYPVYHSLKSSSATTSINSSFSGKLSTGTDKKYLKNSSILSYPRSSSVWSSRVMASSENSSSASSSQCTSTNGHTWTMTATASGGKKGKGEKQRPTGSQPRNTCWNNNTWADQRESGSTTMPCTSTPVTSHSSEFFKSSGNDSSITQGNASNRVSSSQCYSTSAHLSIDVTRTESTHVLNSLSRESTKPIKSEPKKNYLQQKVDVPAASSLADEQSSSVQNVQELFGFMSMQLAPNYRRKADPKNAYKAPPKVKPKPAAGGNWGIVSIFSRLKAKSQKIKLQSKARQERRGSMASGSGKLLLGRLKDQFTPN